MPESYLDAMARQSPPPLWVNLEYLSAESWVGRTPRPAVAASMRLPLTKYFYFPGYTPDTGGLLIERDLPARRDTFRQGSAASSLAPTGAGCADAG